MLTAAQAPAPPRWRSVVPAQTPLIDGLGLSRQPPAQPGRQMPSQADQFLLDLPDGNLAQHRRLHAPMLRTRVTAKKRFSTLIVALPRKRPIRIHRPPSTPPGPPAPARRRRRSPPTPPPWPRLPPAAAPPPAAAGSHARRVSRVCRRYDLIRLSRVSAFEMVPPEEPHSNHSHDYGSGGPDPIHGEHVDPVAVGVGAFAQVQRGAGHEPCPDGVADFLQAPQVAAGNP